ncbi:MAG: LacI family DNA-binding transcriptional regulator [Actinomycetes bacterium]
MVKRSEVAKAAGVSESTISYVITGSKPISEATKRRVLKVMDEMGYKPNAMAKALRSGSSRMIALLFAVSDHGINDGDISYVLGAADEARKYGYHLILWPAYDREIEDAILQAQSGLLDGIVLMEIRMADARVELLHRLKIPVGLIGRTADYEDEIYADRDFEAAENVAFEELVRLGHKKIIFLSTTAKQFRDGFGAIVRGENAAKHLGKKYGVTVHIVHASNSIESGMKAAEQFAEKYQDITGIISLNSEAVIGFSRGIQKLGFRVPKDVSIICIDTIEQGALDAEPSMTTVSPPAAEIGAAAVRGLIKSLRSEVDEKSEKLFVGKLVSRESTALAPKSKSVANK